MKRFRAYDLYDGYELIYESNNLTDCYDACLQRFEDTDGECNCEIRDYETTTSFDIGVYGWSDED
jgi:hypothetical protein